MTRPVYTPEQLSERVGGEIAGNALHAMLHEPDQGMRTEILQEALLDLQRLPHPVEAADGFADGLVVILELSFGAMTARRESTK